jgi:hypothetical protein
MSKILTQVNRAFKTGRRGMNVLRLASNVADTETITIGKEVYEIDTAANPGAITAGRIRINCNAGVTPAIASAAIVAAINGNTTQQIVAVAISANEILIYTNPAYPARLLATTTTMGGANNTWAAAVMYSGGVETVKGDMMMSRAANAAEVAIGNAHFVFPFNPAMVIVQVRTAAGILSAWNGATVITANRVTLDNSGATDWAATDVLTVHASE